MIFRGVVVAVAVSLVAAQWPCPDSAEFYPCTCVQDTSELFIDIDCSNVTNDAELATAFSIYFPIRSVRNFTIMTKPDEPRVGITKLDETIIGNFNITNFRIHHTNLREIGPNTFTYTQTAVETISITDSFIPTFPFDALEFCPNIKDLRLFRNNLIHMSNLYSNSLEHLLVSYNPELQYSDEAFFNTPNLKTIVLNDINLNHVAHDTFSKQTQLEYVDVSYNRLKTLYTDSFKITSPNIREIKLGGNQIDNVQMNAISGLAPGTFLWLQHNLLTNLDQTVWQPVFDSVGSGGDSIFVLDDNPLLCDCNLQWLCTNEAYMDTLAEGAMCSNTNSTLHTLDDTYFDLC